MTKKKKYPRKKVLSTDVKEKKKIKKKKKIKTPEISMSMAAESQLNIKRARRAIDEDGIITSLIKSNNLDLTKVDDYDYMATVARGLDWSIGRLLKVTRRLTKHASLEEKKGEEE